MKKLTRRTASALTAALLALLLVGCGKEGGESGTTTAASSSEGTQAQTTSGGGETSSGSTEAVTDAGTEAPPKIGATGLEAAKGTLPTYIDGPQNHHNLKTEGVFGIAVNCDAPFKAINLYTATYDTDTEDTIYIKVYAWNTDYAASAAGIALVDMTVTGYPNGGWHMITFEQPLPVGEYLVEISGTSGEDDYGTAIWSQYGSPFVITYHNGEEMEDTGIWAQFIIE